MPGASSSRPTASWWGSRSTGRPSCTTPIAAIRRTVPASPRCGGAWTACGNTTCPLNALCCVHRANGDHPARVYRFLRDAGIDFLQFIPVVQPRPGVVRHGRPGSVPADELVDAAKRLAAAVRAVPPRSVRPVAAARRGTSLRPRFRSGPGGLAGGRRQRCASTPVSAAVRWLWNTTATSTPAIISSSPPAGWATSTRRRWRSWPTRRRRGSSAATRRRRCLGSAAAAGAVRLQRRLSQGPLSGRARRPAGPELPMCGLPSVFPGDRPRDAGHGRGGPRRRRGRRRDAPLARPTHGPTRALGRRRPGRPQRSLPLRLRPEIQAMLHAIVRAAWITMPD